MAADSHSGNFRLRPVLEGRHRLMGEISPFLSDRISGLLPWGSTEEKSPLDISSARTGVEQITIIDSDDIALHNLDRLVYADRFSVGLRKVDLAAAHIRRIATALT